MPNELYMFRHSRKLSQQAMADKIGCSRATYSAIELGKNNGTKTFWKNLQNAFDIPDGDMWGLMQVKEK